jgi:hypothetical protein
MVLLMKSISVYWVDRTYWYRMYDPILNFYANLLDVHILFPDKFNSLRPANALRIGTATRPRLDNCAEAVTGFIAEI